MKRKFVYFLFLILCFIFTSEDAFAQLDSKNTELECIYSIGYSVKIRYENGGYKTSIHEYPLASKVNISADTPADIELFDCDGQCPNNIVNYMTSLSCPKTLRTWFVLKSEKSESGDWHGVTHAISAFDYRYSLGGQLKYVTEYYGGTGGTDNSTGWWIFGSSATSRVKVLTVKHDSPESGSPEVVTPLVAERITIDTSKGELLSGNQMGNNYGVAYKSATDNAVGSNKYIQFYRVVLNGRFNKLLAGASGTITSLGDISAYESEYICFKESSSEQGGSGTSQGWIFSSQKHDIKSATKEGENNYTCDSGYLLYKLSDKICEVDTSSKPKSFCDEYGNTAVVLINIIKICQIVVPALVIVLTGIDIGKIVIAGNVEEELPKKKKLIVVRFVIMITFFFLPTITKLVINLINDKEIYDVSCLFNNGVAETEFVEECVDKEDK